jgi:hypothetical protein
MGRRNFCAADKVVGAWIWSLTPNSAEIKDECRDTTRRLSWRAQRQLYFACIFIIIKCRVNLPKSVTKEQLFHFAPPHTKFITISIVSCDVDHAPLILTSLDFITWITI